MAFAILSARVFSCEVRGVACLWNALGGSLRRMGCSATDRVLGAKEELRKASEDGPAYGTRVVENSRSGQAACILAEELVSDEKDFVGIWKGEEMHIDCFLFWNAQEKHPCGG